MSDRDLESDPLPVPPAQLAAPPKILRVRCPFCDGRGGGPTSCGEYSFCRACAARGYINVEGAA